MIAGIVGRYRYEIFPIGGELIENAFRLVKKRKRRGDSRSCFNWANLNYPVRYLSLASRVK